MIKQKSILLLLLSLFTWYLYAQTPSFKSYTSLPGVPKLNVNVIYQDSSGYLWFGTDNELLKFDGINFTRYTEKEGLSNRSVSAIVEDAAGVIWVGHGSGQLSKLTKHGFEAFTPEEGNSIVEITSIHTDKKKNLWYSTMGEGVFYYAGENRKRLYNLNTDEGLADNYVYEIEMDSSGVLYFATDKGVSIYDQNKNEFIDQISMIDGLPDNIVKHIVVKGQTLWIGMYEAGICSYNLVSKKIMTYGDWDFSPIQDFIFSDKNELLISTTKHGLIKGVVVGNELQYSSLGVRSSLVSNRTNTVICDREQNIWVGTLKGISVRRHLGIEFMDENTGFSVTEIYGFTIDKKGNYWIASQHGVYKASRGFNGEIKVDKIPINNKQTGASLAFISIYCDVSGYIWLGTYGYGVYCVNPNNFEVSNYSTKNGLSNENIIHINGDNNNIWLSTLGGGVIQMNRLNKTEIKSYSSMNGLSSDYVYSTFIDNDGTVWCATDGGGVALIQNGAISIYDSLFFNNKARAVYAILKDAQGAMWFNCPELGLIMEDSTGYYIKNDSNSFINGSIVGIASTLNEIISVSDETIEKYSLAEGHSVQYGKNEKVANYKPNLNAVYVDSVNNLWIGTANGIIKINYLEPNYDIKPKLFITDVSLFFESIEDASTTFSYNKNHFTFAYNALWFKDIENLEYRYRLYGFDLDWVQTSTMKRVTYSNLPSGSYRFEVQVNYPGGQWFSTSKSIYEFTIKPPFWKRAWFIILVILIIVFSIYAFVRHRISKLESDKRLLESEVEKRTAEIQKQKEEIEAQRDEIEAQRDHVIVQRDKIEVQNKNITASIQYASRIQNALLPPKTIFEENLKDFFLFFKPRDIVSGDFYFAQQHGNRVIVAAADCTGHGIPGAFMSVLSISLLKQILSQAKPEISASDILNELRSLVKRALQQTGKANEAKDGLDISLCIIEKGNSTIHFSGAFNPLMVVRDGEIIQVKGDKMPIGIFYIDDVPFKNNAFETKDGDMLYLYSDGYQDQFGGGKNRKFLPKRLRDLLLSIADKTMENQHLILDQTFNDWKGKEHQVDDVLVIGIRM